MPVPSNRALERTAVNKLRLLLERHGHIVQEVSGGSDMGEDLIVSFVQGKHRTNEHIAIQVKGGQSYRASVGYLVPVRQHGLDWGTSNVPVVCVVYDPEMLALYWANATEQIAVAGSGSLRSIRIAESAVLNDATLEDFVAQLISFTRAWSRDSSRRTRSAVRNRTVEGKQIGGVPDQYFSPIARWIETHPNALRWTLGVLCAVVIVGLLALMAPGLYAFAVKYSAGGPPWLWPVMIYGYTVVGITAILREARRGRNPVVLRVAVFLPLLLAYYAAISMEFELGLPEIALAMIGTLVPQVVKYAMLLGVVYYVGREIDRRRRIRAIGHDPDNVEDEPTVD